MKKFVSIKGVIDNIRLSVNTPPPSSSATSGLPGSAVRLQRDVIESLSPEQFLLLPTLRHGFPFKPLSLALDPVQRILAIGNRSGVVKIYGRPGIEAEISHENNPGVLQILFLINSGKILTTTSDDRVNLWDYKKKEPELLHSIRLQKESISVVFSDFQDKFVYIGTEKGTLHVLNLESFSLSGYSIPWNKFMDPLSTAQPGGIIIVNANPADPSKILVGFDTGLIVIFDFPSKNGDSRYRYPGGKLTSVSWHMDGRQFVSSHGDGSLVTWNVKAPGSIASCNHTKPASVLFPHGVKDKSTGKMSPCDPIEKVIWCVRRSSEPYFVFSGGLPSDITGVTPSVTLLQGKSSTLLEMEYCVLDFVLLSDSCFRSDYNEPEAIITMLTNDVVALDLKSPGFPCFQNPYAMDFNESPVTAVHYTVDVPSDFIPCLYRVGMVSGGSGRVFSNGEWPVSGGDDSNTESCSYAELVITGHADGSLRFWDSSSSSMQSLYRIKTAKYFEKVKRSTPLEGLEDDPYAITNIRLCPESKILVVSGSAAHVIVFKFRKKESSSVSESSTVSLEIPIIYEVSSVRPEPKSSESPLPGSGGGSGMVFEFPPRPLLNVASQSSSYADPVEGFNFDKPLHEFFSPLRVRQGGRKTNGGGYAPELICLTPWVNGEAPAPINVLCVNSAYGLLAYGNNSGLVIVDILQNVCLLNMGTADLYGSQDPFTRAPKSPRLDASPKDASGGGAESFITRVDLSNYSQVASEASKPESSISRVKSPDCKRLIKAGSSADDSSLSKSSSINSLDNSVINSEGVTALAFAESFPSKMNEYNPCLYVGTSLGSIIVVIVNLPKSTHEEGEEEETRDQRISEDELRREEPVVVSPSGSVYRLRGSVLSLHFLDVSADSDVERVNVFKPATSSESSGNDDSSPDQQILVAVSDKTASSFALPSQRVLSSQTLNESPSSLLVTADVVNFGGSRFNPALMTYASDGLLKAYSLPSLRPMMEEPFPPGDTPKRLAKTLCFGHYGHALYFRNPNELQKFTLSADFVRQLPELKGSLFREGIPTPDPPKQNFFKGLFGGGPKPCDRDELFGETAGKPLSGVAKVVGGSGMANSLNKAVGATNEVSKAKMAMIERGQKLNELEDRTEQMSNEAKNYAANAQKLKIAYQNKRWYQM
eukprot:TRINITY_DN10792_c0_g1_i1.p1 TRINITY_DN10792_c0_g1~~TRINITY_DN10792_c0_g1_i1.p1  ORF type:complete len:1161 (-),score=436.59 TRINITY_DN10792_c0_g1_i1:114-3596(-)